MDGDDAAEFFEAFQRDFGVDLYSLYAHWDQHFSPEGAGSLGAMSTIVLCITAGFWVHDKIGVLPAWACGLTLIGIAGLIHYRLAKDDMIPTTPGDMAQSVRTSRWNKAYFGTC
jgi:hypothetical protein